MPYSHSFSMVDDDVDGIGSGMGPLADAQHANGASALDVGAGSSGTAAASASSHSSSRLLSGLVSQAEHVFTITSRMRNTLTCIVLYIVLMLLNLFVMLWELSGRGYHPAILAVEFLINVWILLEVGLGIWALGRSYFDSVMNRIDAGLALACIAFFVILVIGTQTKEDSGFVSEVDAVLLACRFLFQVVRLSVLVYRSRKVALMQSQEEINFNAISLEACVTDESVMGTGSGGGGLSGTAGDGTSLDGEHRPRRFSASGMHEAFDLTPQHSPASGLGLGLDDADGLDPPRQSNGNSRGHHPPTSYIHLKPSIFLELQNARAFAQPQPIPAVAATGLQPASGSPSLRPVAIGPLDNEHASRSSLALGASGSPPLVVVPILTPPISPEPFAASEENTPVSASAHSYAHSISSGSGGSTGSGSKRAMHPLLANDAELEEESFVIDRDDDLAAQLAR